MEKFSVLHEAEEIARNAWKKTPFSKEKPLGINNSPAYLSTPSPFTDNPDDVAQKRWEKYGPIDAESILVCAERILSEKQAREEIIGKEGRSFVEEVFNLMKSYPRHGKLDNNIFLSKEQFHKKSGVLEPRVILTVRDDVVKTLLKKEADYVSIYNFPDQPCYSREQAAKLRYVVIGGLAVDEETRRDLNIDPSIEEYSTRYVFGGTEPRKYAVIQTTEQLNGYTVFHQNMVQMLFTAKDWKVVGEVMRKVKAKLQVPLLHKAS